MCVGRQIARWIFQDYISADPAIGAVRMEANSFSKQLSAVFQSGDLVIEPLVCELLF